MPLCPGVMLPPNLSPNCITKFMSSPKLANSEKMFSKVHQRQTERAVVYRNLSDFKYLCFNVLLNRYVQG